MLQILIPIGILAAIAGGIVWDAHRTADAVLARGRIEADRLLAEYLARDTRRPPFGGEAIDGDAWDLYRKALPILGNLPEEDAKALPYYFGEGEIALDDQRMAVIFAALEPQIDLLRQALRSQTLGSDRDSLFVSNFPISEIIQTSRLLADQTCHLHRLGRISEAFDSTLLGLGISQDFGRQNAHIGLLAQRVCEAVAIEPIKDFLASHTGETKDWTAYSKSLDALDPLRPLLRGNWDVQDLALRYFLLDGDASSEIKDQLKTGRGWRGLWSEKILRAQALNRLPELMREGRRIIALLPWERVGGAQELQNTWHRESNPITLNWSGLPDFLKLDIKGLMQRTLLRVAVGIAWYETEKGAWPATLQDLVPRYLAAVPPCPYTGTPLRTKDGRVWSIGTDGVDNGGQPKPSNDDPEKAGADVVWVVSRRK